ncbi:MAG: aldo/keto reductase [Defluviitaleaceae bacterium]|nr:aldo/keto reductase [Defluviitaleaceae bacterium]
MKFRTLGKTGLQVSEIGLGCEHLDRKPYAQTKETIDAALAHGVNIFDCFMPGTEIRENMARALGSNRNKVIIQGAVGSTDERQQYDRSRDMTVVKKYFDDMLRVFGYVDIAMLFFVDSEEDFAGAFKDECLEYVDRLKQKGDVRYIGVSSHDPLMAKRAIETGVPEVLFFSLNPAFDMLPPNEAALSHLFGTFDKTLLQGIDPRRSSLYQLCEEKNIGITVMKALGGGKLTSPQHTPFTMPMTVQQCIHYALTRPSVASVLLGGQTAAEVEETMKYYTVSESERDYTTVLGSMRNNFKGDCVYCGHCQPCPVDIDIASVMKFLDIARLTPGVVPPSAKAHYTAMAATGNDCIRCGACEQRCPFDVKIMDSMAEAGRVFK